MTRPGVLLRRFLSSWCSTVYLLNQFHMTCPQLSNAKLSTTNTLVSTFTMLALQILYGVRVRASVFAAENLFWRDGQHPQSRFFSRFPTPQVRDMCTRLFFLMCSSVSMLQSCNGTQSKRCLHILMFLYESD